MSDKHDIVIIGSGAGGATLAHRLAPSGLRVLVLERGDYVPREQENTDPREVFECKRYQAAETWHDRHGQPFSPYTHYCVGGNTKFYGAALLRMREHDFAEVRHYGGVSPAWPITYNELEPYYTEAEHLYSVRGLRGSDPCEPWASAPFDDAPLEPEPRIAELMQQLRATGLRPFPIPLGIRSDMAGPATAPVRLGNFDGYPDPTETKADAHVSALRPALLRPTMTLVTRARAIRLETDSAGDSIERVIVERDGERHEFRARAFVLACGAINSAALLLRSACAGHPRGLANSSGMVGRCYMSHQNGCFIAVYDRPNPSRFQKHFGLTDFYSGDPDDGHGALPLGTIQLMGRSDRGTLEWIKGDALPDQSVDSIKSRTVDFFLTAEDLPDPANRVELMPDGAVRLSYTPNNTEAYDRLVHRFTRALQEAARRAGHQPPACLTARLGISGVSHQSGTLRFGRDPRDSVLDVNCKAHDLDNLYAVDASFFPSSAAVNPSLTIMANALRVGDHLIERLGARAVACAAQEVAS
ncbi:MAG: GMC family oxidoreductase [Phycisphaeraceae bacterium]|nr:GMC family oxidoreductase [Phycisphaeraceae bacterium]